MTGKSILDDPKHWRERAEEARTIAETMQTEDAKRQMLAIANGYDRMCEHAEARLANGGLHQVADVARRDRTEGT